MTPTDDIEAFSSFLGKGWSFPPEFDPDAGTVRMTEDEEDIHASLQILMGTSVGERFLSPQYGLDIQALLFTPLGTTAITYLKDRFKVALLVHEPRINPISIDFDTSRLRDGTVSVILEYEVRATNSRFNLVYPFYQSDASEVRPTEP